MNKHRALLAAHQEERELTKELFLSYIRNSVQESVLELMQSEVEALCGPSYHPPADSKYRRAGSDDGVLYLDGERHSIRRPRVRKESDNGIEEEVPLSTYCRVRNLDNIAEEVVRLVAAGVSTRGARTVRDKAPGKSTISRLWVEGSVAKLDELRSRNLRSNDFFGLVVDGIVITRELVVIVAVGLHSDGRKSLLDFAVGSSENYEVVRELLTRIRERGFRVSGRLFAVLDGSKALHKAVTEFWSDAHIQGCLVHLERNLHRHLRCKDHSECSRLVKRLRNAQGLVAGTEAAADLWKFVSRRNYQARELIENLGETLLTLHALNVPSTLNVSLLSTNLIENAILNYRRHTKRVNRWRLETNQVERWTAAALLRVESGFRKIKGFRQLPLLIETLNKPMCSPIPTAPFRTCPPGIPPDGGHVLHSTVGMPTEEQDYYLDAEPNKENLMVSVR